MRLYRALVLDFGQVRLISASIFWVAFPLAHHFSVALDKKINRSQVLAFSVCMFF
jgi:hypothetical protein